MQVQQYIGRKRCTHVPGLETHLCNSVTSCAFHVPLHLHSLHSYLLQPTELVRRKSPSTAYKHRQLSPFSRATSNSSTVPCSRSCLRAFGNSAEGTLRSRCLAGSVRPAETQRRAQRSPGARPGVSAVMLTQRNDSSNAPYPRKNLRYYIFILLYAQNSIL